MSRITHNFREEFGPRQKCKRGKVYPYFVKYSPLRENLFPPIFWHNQKIYAKQIFFQVIFILFTKNRFFDFLRPAFGYGRLGHPQSLEYLVNLLYRVLSNQLLTHLGKYLPGNVRRQQQQFIFNQMGIMQTIDMIIYFTVFSFISILYLFVVTKKSCKR